MMKTRKEKKFRFLISISYYDFARILGIGFLLFILSNCSPKTTSVSLPVETPENFSESGGNEMSHDWWTVFGDEYLNALVDSALESNFSLQTAWQRLRASQAVLNRESASLFPSLDGTGSAEVNNRQSEFQQSQRFRLGLYSEYEVDLWGRIRANIDAQSFRAQATLADYQAAAISVSAAVVRTYFQLVEAHNQLELAQKQVETNEKVLQLLKVRFSSGQIRSVDILRQVQLVEATREQQIFAESRLQVLEHAMAVLLGKTPQTGIQLVENKLPDVPPIPETGVPAELIKRRPDVRSTFNLLQAADRNLAAAISNQYPRLSISASISTGAYDIQDLFTDWGRGIAGDLLSPLFRGNELRAEVDRVEAVKQQRLYEYGDAVLTAFREVEDALVQENQQKKSIESLERQVELAVQTNEQLRSEYLNGMSNYLDVLVALDEEQQLRRDLLNSKLELIEFRIALYRALAGNIETEPETAFNDNM
ncbi:MAG: efflux transporter outer membrane subunit [Bacteroidota bacterium]